MSLSGTLLRFGGISLRFLQFCFAVIGLGIFSYFLAVLADHNTHIPHKWLAVEALTGAATIYALFTIVSTLCLGGNMVFGALAVLLDVCFIGAFIAVAYFTRHGADRCSGYIRTPLGDGLSGQSQLASDSGIFTNLHRACVLNTVVFACAIICIFLFLLSIVWQILMVRHHRKNKKAVDNTYEQGSAKYRFWKREPRGQYHGDVTSTQQMTSEPIGTTVRPSYETSTTVGRNEATIAEHKHTQPIYQRDGVTPYHNTATRNP